MYNSLIRGYLYLTLERFSNIHPLFNLSIKYRVLLSFRLLEDEDNSRIAKMLLRFIRRSVNASITTEK